VRADKEDGSTTDDEDGGETLSTAASSVKSSPVSHEKLAFAKRSKEVEFKAIKILSKKAVMDAKQVDHVYNEIALQPQLKHPFLVRYFSF
jgi:hypothetical protein